MRHRNTKLAAHVDVTLHPRSMHERQYSESLFSEVNRGCCFLRNLSQALLQQELPPCSSPALTHFILLLWKAIVINSYNAEPSLPQHRTDRRNFHLFVLLQKAHHLQISLITLTGLASPSRNSTIPLILTADLEHLAVIDRAEWSNMRVDFAEDSVVTCLKKWAKK